MTPEVRADNDHACECSVCVRRYAMATRYPALVTAARTLLDCLPPGVVLTIGGREIDHTDINQARERLKDATAEFGKL